MLRTNRAARQVDHVAVGRERELRRAVRIFNAVCDLHRCASDRKPSAVKSHDEERVVRDICDMPARQVGETHGAVNQILSLAAEEILSDDACRVLRPCSHGEKDLTVAREYCGVAMIVALVGISEGGYGCRRATGLRNSE